MHLLYFKRGENIRKNLRQENLTYIPFGVDINASKEETHMTKY